MMDEPSWKQIFKNEPQRKEKAVRSRSYGRKPDGNQAQGYKDEND